MSSILDSREERSLTIRNFLVQFELVISVKANTPGPDKNRYSSLFLVRLFSNQVANELKISYRLYDSLDGHYALFLINDSDPKTIKTQMITIEETHQLGRLIDIDVHHNKLELHREHPRKCLICELDAFACVKCGTHSLTDLLKKTDTMIFDYLTEHIRFLIDTSMMMELNLDPKFGLVTPTSSGSHSDMDYPLMVRAKNIILPFFIKIFKYSIETKNSLEVDKSTLIKIGIEAESEMYLNTNRINAYKGLIYHLGYVLYTLAKVIKNGDSFDSIFPLLRLMNNDYIHEFEVSGLSTGKKLFIERGIGGARKEMALGLPHVQEALIYLNEFYQSNLYDALISLIVSIEDTTFLKRVNDRERESVINLFKNLDVNDANAIQKLNDLCVSKHYTFGGAADLLVVSIFLSYVRKLLF